MPINDYNPVVSGIMNAYGLADRLRSYALQQQRLKFEQEREQRMTEQAEREATRQDLQTRLTLATHPALVGVGTEPTRTIQGKLLDPQLAKAYGAPEVEIGGVPTEGALEYGGRRYAVRDLEERENIKAAAEQRAAERELQQRIRQAVGVHQATAVPVPATIGDPLGLTGTLVAPSSLAELARAGMTQEGTPVNWQSQMTDQGLVQVNPRSGEVRQPTLTGAKLTRTPRTSTGELTEYQRGQQERGQRQDRRQRLVDLEDREDRAAKSVADIYVKIATNKDEKGKVINRAQDLVYQSQLTRAKASLERVRRQKVSEGFTTAEEANLVKAAQEGKPEQALVGRTVRLADGRQVTVKKVNDDGSFEY